jgi:hypothetical protein
MDTILWNTLGRKLQRFCTLADLYVMLKILTRFLAPLPGNDSYFLFRPSLFSYCFLFWFHLYPRYPWSSHPFNSSPHLRVSFASHHLLLIHFFPDFTCNITSRDCPRELKLVGITSTMANKTHISGFAATPLPLKCRAAPTRPRLSTSRWRWNPHHSPGLKASN